MHTHTHMEEAQSSESGRGSPPLSVYIAAVPQSDKGERRFRNSAAAGIRATPSGPTLNTRIML